MSNNEEVPKDILDARAHQWTSVPRASEAL